MSDSPAQPERLPFWKKIMYALGQFGWSLASFSAANLLIAYYQPADGGGGAQFPTMIPQGYLVGVLTVVGLVFALGMAFDGVANPVVAVLSDRSRMRLGKRRGFMAIACLPTALLSLALFCPPFGAGPGANLLGNAVWLAAATLLFYWFLTMYVTPYTALLTEIGHDTDERLQLSTMISVTWALGFMVGSQSFALTGVLQAAGLAPEQAFRLVMAQFALLSALAMALPVIFVDERRYCRFQPSDDGLLKALGKIGKERNFLRWVSQDFVYWVALTFISSGMVYFMTSLLGLPAGFVSLVMVVLFLVSFALYVPVGVLARRLGKKRLLSFAFLLFALSFAFVGLLGLWPVDPAVQGVAVALLAAPALAVFSVLPNAMVGDMAEVYANRNGEQKGGLFFGFRTLMMKLSQGLGGLLLPSLLLVGARPGAAVGAPGVRLVAWLAFALCLLGFLLLRRYDESAVEAGLKRG